ncbi:MAG: RNA polymerase sigma factor [Solirubrobacteraceae bacterium]
MLSISAADATGGLRRTGQAHCGLVGSERAFAALYERYHQPMYRYCRSMVRNDADAQDALQSTFAGALMALPRQSLVPEHAAAHRLRSGSPSRRYDCMSFHRPQHRRCTPTTKVRKQMADALTTPGVSSYAPEAAWEFALVPLTPARTRMWAARSR